MSLFKIYSQPPDVKRNRTNWLLGLLIIFLIYSIFYVLFHDNKDVVLIPRKIRHVIKFLTTLSVYVVGTFYLKKLHAQWMHSLWHLIHIGGLILIISIGLFDWLISPTSKPIRYFANFIQEMLISPVLYVGMSILNQTLARISNSPDSPTHPS